MKHSGWTWSRVLYNVMRTYSFSRRVSFLGFICQLKCYKKLLTHTYPGSSAAERTTCFSLSFTLFLSVWSCAHSWTNCCNQRIWSSVWPGMNHMPTPGAGTKIESPENSWSKIGGRAGPSRNAGMWVTEEKTLEAKRKSAHSRGRAV